MSQNPPTTLPSNWSFFPLHGCVCRNPSPELICQHILLLTNFRVSCWLNASATNKAAQHEFIVKMFVFYIFLFLLLHQVVRFRNWNLARSSNSTVLKRRTLWEKRMEGRKTVCLWSALLGQKIRDWKESFLWGCAQKVIHWSYGFSIFNQAQTSL